MMAHNDGNSSPVCTFNSYRDRHKEYIPGSKKLGQGQVIRNVQEEFLSQEEEREFVDVLLDFSSEDENLDLRFNSLNWEEVAVGWRQTVPNVTYVTRATCKEPDFKKDLDGEKDRSRNAQLRLLQIEKDLSWKHCVEPGTYRYRYKWPNAGVRRKNVGKGPVDANLEQHVRKVREHLDRVFAQQASQKLKQRPLGGVCNHVDYVKSLIREAKPSQIQPKVETIFSPDSPSQEIKTTVPDVGLTYTIKHGSGPIQKSLHVHVAPQKTPPQSEKKPTADLVATMGSKLNDLIEQDNLKLGRRTTNSKKKMGDNLSSSYGKFTSPSQVESPILNPLMKVTPSQRKIHDDNELIRAVAKMNKRLIFPTDEGYSSHSPDHESLETGKDETLNPRFRLLDPANNNLFTSGIAGKAVCSSDTRVDVQNIESMSTKRKKGSRVSRKQRTHDVTSHGDNRLHRGVVDRGIAEAIASRILPGVNGQKIQFPLQRAYRIT